MGEIGANGFAVSPRLTLTGRTSRRPLYPRGPSAYDGAPSTPGPICMRIDITKGKTDDAIAVARADGSRAETRFPKKGPIPHDGVHVIVERALGLSDAFWGHVARGRHPEEIAPLAAEAGHPSAKRARDPDAAIVQMIQAERLVECFEAEVWGGPGDLAVLQSVADAAMAQSKVPAVPLGAEAVARIRDDLAAFAAAWRALPTGGRFGFDWPE